MLKSRIVCLVVVSILVGACTTSAHAQDFSAGVVGGIGLARGMTAEIPNGASAKAGVRSSAAAGFFFRDDMYPNVSGEFRYLYRFGAHKVSNDTASASLGAHSHIFHYDLLFHLSPGSATLRPYVAVGAGGRVYQGTGTPPRTQPLSNLALLRKATETRPMLSLGGGVRWAFGGNKMLQLDLRDYITPAPRKIFAPSTTSMVSGWLHDFVPQIGLGVRF